MTSSSLPHLRVENHPTNLSKHAYTMKTDISETKIKKMGHVKMEQDNVGVGKR